MTPEEFKKALAEYEKEVKKEKEKEKENVQGILGCLVLVVLFLLVNVLGNLGVPPFKGWLEHIETSEPKGKPPYCGYHEQHKWGTKECWIKENARS